MQHHVFVGRRDKSKKLVECERVPRVGQFAAMRAGMEVVADDEARKFLAAAAKKADGGKKAADAKKADKGKKAAE